MATAAVPVEEPRFRPPEPKLMRSPKSRSSSLKHKTRSPADAVRKSEQALHQLLEDFEEGRLNAFGKLLVATVIWRGLIREPGM